MIQPVTQNYQKLFAHPPGDGLCEDMTANAVSYLRLRSTAAATDPAGMLVERVAVEVSP